jgi:RNase P/RNase MRP subunit p30
MSFLNKDLIKKYRKSKEADQKLIKIINNMEVELGINLQKLLQQIKEIKERKENINNFEDGLNANHQDFTKFKIAYRNVVGKVYE